MSESVTAPAVKTIPAQGNLHGMVVLFEGEQWEILDRHPRAGFWWIHRRDAAGEWVTDYARSRQMKQVIQ